MIGLPSARLIDCYLLGGTKSAIPDDVVAIENKQRFATNVNTDGHKEADMRLWFASSSASHTIGRLPKKRLIHSVGAADDRIL